MQQATSHISKTRIFYLTLVDLLAFFLSHPIGHDFWIKWLPIDCQDPATSDGSFIAVPLMGFFEHREDHGFESIQAY